MIEVKAPGVEPDDVDGMLRVFLAGSIDMGSAVHWQSRVVEALTGLDVLVYNPRRDDWDSSWEQSITNPKFYEQVDWEMSKLMAADVVVFYFDPNGPAPITLLELGLHAHLNGDQKIMVCCPEGYWRKGNVDMVCERYEVDTFSSLNEMIESLRNHVVLA